MAESELHHHLKDRAVGWLLQRGCFTACTEVNMVLGGKVYDAGGVRKIDILDPAKERRYIYGVEVKVSRADFLRETNPSGKLALYELGAASYPHYCYLLCPEGLVVPDEIPADWGLLYWDERRVVSVKRARRNDATPGWLYLNVLELMAGQLTGRLRDITRETRLPEGRTA